MESVTYVMYAGMVMWAAFGIYLFSLARKQNAIAKRLAQLTALLEDKE